MKLVTIANAKNVLPDNPAIMLYKDSGGAVVACPVFRIIYEPEQQKAPAHEQMGKAQG